jgi:hypothetical protein
VPPLDPAIVGFATERVGYFNFVHDSSFVKLISSGQNVEGKAQRDALIAQVARSAASAQRALNHQGAGVDGRAGYLRNQGVTLRLALHVLAR